MDFAAGIVFHVSEFSLQGIGKPLLSGNSANSFKRIDAKSSSMSDYPLQRVLASSNDNNTPRGIL